LQLIKATDGSLHPMVEAEFLSFQKEDFTFLWILRGSFRENLVLKKARKLNSKKITSYQYA